MSQLKCHILYDKVTPALWDLIHTTSFTFQALHAIGKHLVKTTEERFATETDPNGVKWKELADPTIKRKGHDDILYDGGELSESIDYDVNGPTQLIVGSTREFEPGVSALIHQLGGWSGRYYGTWTPQRSFLGVSSEDVSAIERILGDYLKMKPF